VNPGHHIDYKQLRRIDPQAARMAVLNYHESVAGNISRTAKAFGINRCVVYDILKKQASRDLSDRSRAPKHQPRSNKISSRKSTPRDRCGEEDPGQTGRYGVPGQLLTYLEMYCHAGHG